MSNSHDICIIGASCSFGENIKQKLTDFKIHSTNKKILDVTKLEDVKLYFSQFKKLHGLVYCPAVKGNYDALAHPDYLRQQLEVNLFGAINCLQTALPIIENGKIVVIGSADGTFANYPKTMYSVSKAALHQFTKCFAIQAKSHNIETICIVPGTIKTEKEKNDISDYISCFMNNKIRNLYGQLIRIDGGHHTFPL